VHAQFADAYGDCEVTRNERDLANRLYSFANAIDLGDYTIPDDVDVRHEAFICAAGLQNLHPIMQREVAEREGARNVPPGRSVSERSSTRSSVRVPVPPEGALIGASPAG
jgi:hypothetical protein